MHHSIRLALILSAGTFAAVDTSAVARDMVVDVLAGVVAEIDVVAVVLAVIVVAIVNVFATSSCSELRRRIKCHCRRSCRPMSLIL